MQKNKSLLYGFIVLIIIVGAGVFALVGADYLDSDNNNSTDVVEDSQKEIVVSVVINEEDGTQSEYDVTIAEGATAEEVLQVLANENKSFGYSAEQFDFGTLITEINSLEPDGNSEFIEVLLNGETAQQGVSTLQMEDGDVLTFQISQILAF